MTNWSLRLISTGLAVALCWVPGPTFAIDPARVGGLFSSGQVNVFKRRDMPAAAVKQQTEEALAALTDLTFLSENDARQYARDPQSLIGYYAYLKPDKEIVLLGGSRQVQKQKIALKDDVIFRGVVKSGYDAGIGIPILKVNLKSDQVAELSIQDIIMVGSSFTADEIACNFPHAWRQDAAPAGPRQYYYIPNATVSAMNTRRFYASNRGLSGLFSIVSLGGTSYYSDEASSTKYLVTVSLAPVSPLSIEKCQLVAKRSAAADGRLEVNLETTGAADELDVIKDLQARRNEADLRGASVGVSLEMFPSQAN